MSSTLVHALGKLNAQELERVGKYHHSAYQLFEGCALLGKSILGLRNNLFEVHRVPFNSQRQVKLKLFDDALIDVSKSVQ